MKLHTHSPSINSPRGFRQHQNGAILAEFVIIAPIVMFIGMTTVQAALVYHGKTTLNYATFEAARTGATNHAQLELMRKELGIRLAPIEGGDGSAQSAMVAMAKSSLAVLDKSSTRMKVLNPTSAAFEDWGIDSQEFNQRVLPNTHLRHREHTVGTESGLSLRDANLLKIEVTHGVDLKVPFVNTLISKAMLLVDPDNASYYLRNQFPLKSVATVRMQSEAWEEQIVMANLPPVADTEDDPTTVPVDGSQSVPGESEDDGAVLGECEEGESGLGMSPVLIDASDYDPNECSGGSSIFDGVGDVEGGCGT
ncbi:TadE/TadG family type IV pilus assembly protein [Granulosicoccus antarcticus]|uniref:TadE-like domain-containing protein n=1 Tax=Granulosicoccus antarcticus IMCC3135 TaxID=1192854 RepID=A0A2Z2P290_9GAMM|nr:TadE family protein [Granulosicoccus antarcticus]ASJ74647.1 hypothetical protein IMCC3135_22885 [Granulosicoccus antarcticus IMCC3135]